MFSSRLSGWLVVFLLAICAGTVGGALLLFWYVSPRFQALDQALSQRLDRVRAEVKPIEVIRIEREPTAPVIPSVFLQGRRSPVVPLVKRATRINEDNVFTSDRFVGSLTVLTVDGWLLGSAQTFDQLRVADVGVVWEGRVHPLLRAVRDTASGLVYVKVALQNLPVAGFARGEDVITGLPVWVESFPGRVSPNVVIDARERGFQGVAPSERLIRRYALNEGGTGSHGGAVWNEKGQLIGVMEVGAVSSRVIPISSVATALASLSSSQDIRYATLGVSGFDASLLLSEAGRVNRSSQGFFIRGARGVLAVDPKGPSTSVLKEGDVLQRIDQDILDTATDLAHRLAQYRPGTRLAVSGERAGVSFQVNVVLGSVVTSEVLK